MHVGMRSLLIASRSNGIMHSTLAVQLEALSASLRAI